MVSPALKPYVSYAEYLALEEKSETKHEWLDGQIYDMEALGMAGGKPEHALRIAAVVMALGAQLRGKRCNVYSSDLKVRIRATAMATYPDVSVVCGKLEVDPEDSLAAVNPVVLVEVLSPSSEAYDRGAKFGHYRRIPSLRDYVLVNHRESRIEVHHRNDAGRWELYEAAAGQSVEVASIGCVLSVDEIYADPLAEPETGAETA
jgi:Uma2 family endonuclease